MSAPSLRSKSGCFACKRRFVLFPRVIIFQAVPIARFQTQLLTDHDVSKSKPTCLRCAKSGLECRYVAPPHESKSRIKTRFIYESPMMAGPLAFDRQQRIPHSAVPPSPPSPPTALACFLDLETDTNTANELYFPFVHSPSDHLLDFSLPRDDSWHPTLVQPSSFRSRRTGQTLDQIPTHPEQVADQLALVLSPNSDSSTPYASSSQSRASRPPSDISTASMTAGQASLFQALLSLARPEDSLVLSAFENLSCDSQGAGLPSLESDLDPDPLVNEDREEHDLEGIERNLCIVPTLSRNAESNTLAFVLTGDKDARWFASTVYDPLRIASQAKQDIIRQVTSSQPTRTRVILVANAFRMLGSTVDLNARGASLLTVLRTEVHQDLSLFKSRSPSTQRERDMSAALQMLENILEVVSVHFYTSSLPIVLELLQAVAPVFRRACPEPPEQLVNLPRMLIEPGLYRRYFAVMDVGLSVVTNRPQLFRYDVSYTAEVRERMIKQDYTADFGLEWLYGIPDRFILLFAWINGLREDYYEGEVDSDIVSRVEEQIKNERVGQNLHTATDSDPVFRIRRLVVQECWPSFQLSQALCGASAADPRVDKAFSIFMRLIRETKPARNPDEGGPRLVCLTRLVQCGVAARNEKDRETFKQRILAVRECSVPGIVGNGGVHVLQDIWARTDLEGRPAIWADFSISYKRVVGI
ncbi:fungal zn(2)-Cys(6) binuclear cluster domain-containing protein [Rhizoctonia solani AG-1 IA]|uniref:Fungal zn(2)-Cys(6) binuclear cluster domain-containing protein n=1 Tax=Thanatephorus cucumeris (strain AG1-IA) TaxID=983506 RepID=L8WHY4_THACA|nr:fungal zn(2)-Cys(6) binuclear cluster domain-containing protein [Rhizoctonia solani AG-1 IA]